MSKKLDIEFIKRTSEVVFDSCNAICLMLEGEVTDVTIERLRAISVMTKQFAEEVYKESHGEKTMRDQMREESKEEI